jgi:hypothetical protein
MTPTDQAQPNDLETFTSTFFARGTGPRPSPSWGTRPEPVPPAKRRNAPGWERFVSRPPGHYRQGDERRHRRSWQPMTDGPCLIASNRQEPPGTSLATTELAISA